MESQPIYQDLNSTVPLTNYGASVVSSGIIIALPSRVAVILNNTLS